jgi:hypothetical protein
MKYPKFQNVMFFCCNVQGTVCQQDAGCTCAVSAPPRFNIFINDLRNAITYSGNLVFADAESTYVAQTLNLLTSFFTQITAI